MATSMNAYEKLYNNMKTRFTVVNEDCECSLGEYMLSKAGKEKEELSDLPVATLVPQQPSAVVSFVNYINDKLMVKEAPQKDKVIRTFPFRTAAAALLSALLVCTFVITYGATHLNSASTESEGTYMSISEDIKPESPAREFRVN